MSLTATDEGSKPLALVVVRPAIRENLGVRFSYIECKNGDGKYVVTGARLRFDHLIVLDSTSRDHYYRAATKDVNGVWTEFSDTVTSNLGDFTSGGALASIGSGQVHEERMDEPAVNFPDLSLGSGIMRMNRTLVSDGFYDETRKQKWDFTRVAIKLNFQDLDENQTMLLHRWYRQTNGGLRPFYFTFTDPLTGDEILYACRVRDANLTDELFTVDRSSMSFTIVQLQENARGGNV